MQVTAEFVTSAAGARDFPRDRLAEVAIVGRSNVGKSSLINALVRRQIARTSAAPGKTRLANFYRVKRGTGSPLYLVDLPGYGYARASKQTVAVTRSATAGRIAAAGEFDQLVHDYFARATGAARPAGSSGAVAPIVSIGVLLLVDSRHPGLGSDRETWDWIGTLPCPHAIVGTKVDKLTRAERTRHTRELESLFDVPVLLVSAQDGEGLEELWKLIARLPNQTAA